MASYHKEQRQEQPQASALAAEPFCSQDIEAIEITLAESECESDQASNDCNNKHKSCH